MDGLTQARDHLFGGLDHDLEEPKLLNADQWVVNSLLQKSIRRGEVDVAQIAALTFLGQKGSAIWRRLMIIAFEDVGAASPELVTTTVSACTDKGWRRRTGGDAIVAVHLARLLAEIPKSRSAEHLITGSNHHPSLEKERTATSSRSMADNLVTIADKSNSAALRALAAWCVSGIGWKQEKKPGNDLPGLLNSFRNLGAPDELVAATGIAAAKIRDPITLMVPLVWLVVNDGR